MKWGSVLLFELLAVSGSTYRLFLSDEEVLYQHACLWYNMIACFIIGFTYSFCLLEKTFPAEKNNIELCFCGSLSSFSSYITSITYYLFGPSNKPFSEDNNLLPGKYIPIVIILPFVLSFGSFEMGIELANFIIEVKEHKNTHISKKTSTIILYVTLIIISLGSFGLFALYPSHPYDGELKNASNLAFGLTFLFMFVFPPLGCAIRKLTSPLNNKFLCPRKCNRRRRRTSERHEHSGETEESIHSENSDVSPNTEIPPDQHYCFPLGTFICNLVASAVSALLAVFSSEEYTISADTRLYLKAFNNYFVGCLSTYSTFIKEHRTHAPSTYIIYVICSVASSLAVSCIVFLCF